MKPVLLARFWVGVVMLILAFLGMVITDIFSTGGWNYWKWIVPVYAILALWLSWYVKRETNVVSPITLWYELIHWAGLILAIFLVSSFVSLGSVSRFTAGLFDLTLLGFGVFLAGVYIERTFLFVGIVLGIFTLLAAIVAQYLYAFLIPVLLAGIAIVGIITWLSHKKLSQKL